MAKPSKRMAARQAELSRRKKQHRPLGEPSEGSAGAAVADEPAMDEGAESAPTMATSSPTEATARPEMARQGQAAFRQPSFRSAARTRTTATTRPDGQPLVAGAASAVGRPMPKNPYQGRDLRVIGIITTLLLGGLIVLKLVL